MSISHQDRYQAFAESWPEVRREIALTWGVFSEDEIDVSNRDWNRLVSIIRSKTGESAPVVEAKLDFILENLDGELGV